jgi:hypothetical protein
MIWNFKRQTEFASTCCLMIGCIASPSSPQNPVPSNSTVVLTWTRDGGIAGFCDEMKISAAGEITTFSCRPPGAGPARTLTGEDLARFNRWRTSFGAVSIESKDPPGADAMTVKLTLQGTGGGQPTETDRQEMLDWAQRVYTQSRS